MIVSDKQKFLFVHIPRTGGTQLSNLLWKGFGSELRVIYEQHGAFRCQKEAELAKFQSYFKFTIIRNPIERLISWYGLVNSTYDNLIDFYKTQNHPGFFFNQLDYIINQNEEMAIDECYRFEKLDEEIERLGLKLGLKLKNNQKVNQNPKSQIEISEFELEFLVEKCKRDLDYFNYPVPALEALILPK